MVTARRGQDGFRTKADGVFQHNVRCDVAGMQGKHKVWNFTRRRFIGIDVAAGKGERHHAERRCCFVAVSNDVGLEIDTVHLDGASLDGSKIMIDCKGQVAFPTAEVINDDRAVPRQCAVNIVDQF